MNAPDDKQFKSWLSKKQNEVNLGFPPRERGTLETIGDYIRGAGKWVQGEGRGDELLKILREVKNSLPPSIKRQFELTPFADVEDIYAAIENPSLSTGVMAGLALVPGLGDVAKLLKAKKVGKRFRPRPMSAKSKLVDNMEDAFPAGTSSHWAYFDRNLKDVSGVYNPSKKEISLNKKKWLDSDNSRRMELLRHEDGHAVWDNLSKESKADIKMWSEQLNEQKRESGYLIGDEVRETYPDSPEELWAEVWRAATTGEGWENFEGVFDGYVREAIIATKKSQK